MNPQHGKQQDRTEKSSGIRRGGCSMRFGVTNVLFEVALVVALTLLLNSCGGQKGCPTCGTTVNGAYAVLNVVPVPEHNQPGAPRGPFNSFDISWFDPVHQLVYTADRIGLDVVVTDAAHNFAVNTIGGFNHGTKRR